MLATQITMRCRSWRTLQFLRSVATFAAARLPEARVAALDEVRGVLRLGGPGVMQFLQGLVTNDVLALEAPGTPPMYACLLNAQGRYLHDMLFFRTTDAEPTVYLDTDSRGKEDLLRLLKRYRLRQKFEIEDVSSQYSVWVQYGGPAAQPTGPWQLDPRLPQLGLRAVLPKDAAPTPAATSSSGGGGSAVAEGSWREYVRWRIAHGVAEGDGEIPSGEVIPLEFNIDGLNGISFTKGCYVGQELMARTHFKGVVRKRAMPFRLRQPAAAGATVQPGIDVHVRDGSSGQYSPVGRVRVADGDLGLAILRLGKAMPAIDAGRPLYVRCRSSGECETEEGEGGGYVELDVWRPDWWPVQWGREEQQAGGE